jgi:hypothetical protein
MPSTYTDNGGIELPANGEQASTWGNTVNVNMQIVDRLTNGVGAITLSGTTHALTTSNGVVSDGQYKVLVLGGSPSGTNTITVAPNDAQHLYIVKNNSGQTAAFTQGSGANISVLSGTTKIIYCDGAGSGAAVVDVTGSLDLGALIVGGTTVTATGTELNILDGVTSTTAELNILDGVTSTTAELNILDGVTSTTAELNILDGVTSSTAELNILDGVTSTTAELNILDGVTATTAEINILDGVTATTAELNILDGVTATAAELNYVDGVTSNIQTQVDAKAANTTQATAVWETGTATTETIVSPANVKAAIIALYSEASAPDFTTQTNFNSGITTAAHGLGAVPSRWEVKIVCTTSNVGYAVGDVISLTSHNEGNGARGNTASVNATNIQIAGNSIYVIPKAGGGVSVITNSSWDVILECWK